MVPSRLDSLEVFLIETTGRFPFPSFLCHLFFTPLSAIPDVLRVQEETCFLNLEYNNSTWLQGSAYTAGGYVQLQSSLQLTSPAFGHRRLWKRRRQSALARHGFLQCAVSCHSNLYCGESYVLLLWSGQSYQLFFGWASCLEDKISAFWISVNDVPLGVVYFVRISQGRSQFDCWGLLIFEQSRNLLGDDFFAIPSAIPAPCMVQSQAQFKTC